MWEVWIYDRWLIFSQCMGYGLKYLFANLIEKHMVFVNLTGIETYFWTRKIAVFTW